MELQKSQPEYRQVKMESKFFMLMYHLKVSKCMDQKEAEKFWNILRDEFNAEYDTLCQAGFQPQEDWLARKYRIFNAFEKLIR